MHKVSVIIPCYNAGEFLDEAVRSAVEQTHRDLEVVIVDDGSTDQSTLSVLKNSAWERTRIVRQDNKGLAGARNAGIRAAEGEFILPLDADDLIEPNYVEKALTIFSRSPEVGLVYCKATRFGFECGEWVLPDYDLKIMLLGNLIFCTALYRKSDWERVGGYCDDLPALEDYDFWLKLISLGVQVHRIDEILFRYRTHKSSMIKDFYTNDNAVISTNARIFRNNKELFAQNAEVLFEHRLKLCRRIDELTRQIENQRPINKLKNFLLPFPRLERLAQYCYRKVLNRQRNARN